MTITTEQADALIALAAALEACHKLNMNVVGREDKQVSLMIHGQHRVITHTLDHKAIRAMSETWIGANPNALRLVK